MELDEQGYAGEPDIEQRQALRLRIANWLCWAHAIRPGIEHGFFSDPGWDTLLELYLDLDRHQHCSISDLSSRTGAGPGTIKRWMALLDETGYVKELSDHEAGFALSAPGLDAMNKYFDTLASKVCRLAPST